MPAPVADYCAEQGRGVFRRGALCHSPPFGLPVMFEYLRIVRKIDPWPPLWNLGKKSGQKNGLNLNENLFFVFMFLVFIFLIWFLSAFSNFWLHAWPPLSKIPLTPLKQGLATYIPWAVSGPRFQTSIRDPYVTSGSRWLRNQILLWNYPNIWRNLFFFLWSSTTNAKNYLKVWWIPCFIFFLSNDSKTCKVVFKWR